MRFDPHSQQNEPLARRLAIPVAAVLVASALQALILPVIRLAPFMLLHGATFTAAWLGGPVAGLVASLLGAAIGNLFFLSDGRGFATSLPALAATALFVGIGMLFSALSAARRTALLQARAAEAALQRTADALRDEARHKDEFIAMLAHELRGPLQPMTLVIDLLARRGGAEREVGVLARQVKHMQRLVDDLFDVSRLRSGKLEVVRRPMDLAAALEGARELSAPLVKAKGHTLELRVEGPLRVEGDQSRLVQLLGNLLTNAAKYTEPGGRIEVRARAEGNAAIVSVKDNGRGMDAELLSRIFEPFVQGERASSEDGGLGLGLSIARSIANLHDGQLTARSEGPGRGAEFVLRLPLRAPPPALEARPQGSAAG